MKKEYMAFLCIVAFLCIAALLLTGCARTPEADIVTRKNTEALTDKAAGGTENRKSLAENRKQTPEHYSWKYNNDAETLQISADADILLPECEAVPMYRLSSGGFTQEQVTGLYDYLFQGRETYRVEEGGLTKSECEKQIVRLRKQLEELEQQEQGDGQGDDDWFPDDEREYLQGILDERLAMYGDLPEVSQDKKIAVDSTLMEQTGIDEREDGRTYEETTHSLECQTDEGDSLYVESGSVDTSEFSLLSYQRPGRYTYSSGIAVPVDPGNADEKKSENLPCTYQDARALADGAVQAAGITAEITQVELLEGLAENGEDGVSSERSGMYSAFQFQYTRTFEGISVATTASEYVNEEEFSLMWPYEKLRIVVSEVGIQEMEWEAPVSVVETVEKDVPVLSFADAAAVFEELTPLSYEGKIEKLSQGETDASMDIHVDAVRLELMRVKNDGSKREGLYVPAWVFYGTESSTVYTSDSGSAEETWSETEPTPWIVLAVNAVDGTVIDQVEGY
ncbi:MAG TPA: hypothetical protein DF613_15255 [Lachnospiraceae bacterium]|nr:hypothetical protein [Lachnospiraceae bacterium]